MPGVPGASGASVSNGREVVRTDAKGAHSLGVTDETILFITKPSGYMVPVDEVQLPQLYYVHYPNGTPFRPSARRGVSGLPPDAPSGPVPLARCRTAWEALAAAPRIVAPASPGTAGIQ